MLSGPQAAKDPKLESLLTFVCHLRDRKGNMHVGDHLSGKKKTQKADERMQMMSFDYPFPAGHRLSPHSQLAHTLPAVRLVRARSCGNVSDHEYWWAHTCLHPGDLDLGSRPLEGSCNSSYFMMRVCLGKRGGAQDEEGVVSRVVGPV